MRNMDVWTLKQTPLTLHPRKDLREEDTVQRYSDTTNRFYIVFTNSGLVGLTFSLSTEF